MKNLRVTVDGKIFNVTVEMLDEAPAVAAPKAPAPAAPAAPAPAPVAAAPAPAAPAAPAPSGGAGEVLSPLSGKVVSIDVALGQDVKEGAQVATIEAMKMNTYVFAPRSGKVTAIVATPGAGVEEGRALLVIG